jgi:eukaryotic-like serine/threonine-protein kinase
MALASGTKLGPYEIQSPLGAGGMGEVYGARDTRLGPDVAVKILPTHLADNAGAKDGISYLVMEYLEGETLCCDHGFATTADFHDPTHISADARKI